MQGLDVSPVLCPPAQLPCIKLLEADGCRATTDSSSVLSSLFFTKAWLCRCFDPLCFARNAQQMKTDGRVKTSAPVSYLQLALSIPLVRLPGAHMKTCWYLPRFARLPCCSQSACGSINFVQQQQLAACCGAEYNCPSFAGQQGMEVSRWLPGHFWG